MFEGEYLNGQRHGKGVDYFDSKKIFEGDYYNVERYDRENYYDVRRIFEGEYLNGKKWNGKIHTPIISEIKNGKGYIKEVYKYDDYFIFEGNYLYGQRKGKNTEKAPKHKIIS